MSQLSLQIAVVTVPAPTRGSRRKAPPSEAAAPPKATKAAKAASPKRPRPEAGIVNLRIVRLLQVLSAEGDTTRATLLDFGWVQWQLDRTVYKARRKALIEPGGVDGGYSLTDLGRAVLRAPDPMQALGTRPRKKPARGDAVETTPAIVEVSPPPDPAVQRRRDAVRERVDRWVSGLRPEVRVRLEAEGHVARLVEHAWRCAGLA